MKSNQETTQDVKTISKGDIFCLFFFFRIASGGFVCVCVRLWHGGFYYAKVCTSPPHHILLWPTDFMLLPDGLCHVCCCQKPPHKNHSRYQGGNGTCTQLIPCCTSTSSAHKIRQETELLFTCLKAVTAAAIKYCHCRNMRLFDGLPSPSGIG